VRAQIHLLQIKFLKSQLYSHFLLQIEYRADLKKCTSARSANPPTYTCAPLATARNRAWSTKTTK